MTQTEFRVQLADFLATDADSVGNEAVLESLGWDSLALLSVIGLVEEELGIEVGEKELNACKTVGEMISLFGDHWTAE